jgi:GNAT superfamily N-acetyltransferase
VPGNYCRVFIAAKPNDPTQIWGYYTLSAALIVKEQLSNADKKRASRDYLGYPAPMVCIGFMGRDDTAPRGLGSALIVDAARRVHRNGYIAVWGLVLKSEGGPTNRGLWGWYEKQGFKACRKTSNSMYGALSAFIPELQV